MFSMPEIKKVDFAVVANIASGEGTGGNVSSAPVTGE